MSSDTEGEEPGRSPLRTSGWREAAGDYKDEGVPIAHRGELPTTQKP